jgi:hypothetical protein
VVLRARGLIATVCAVAGVGALIALGTIVGHGVHPGVRAIGAVILIALIAGVARLTQAGLRLDANEVVIRDLTSTDRLSRAEVLGLATQPVGLGRFRRIAVVCTDGRVLPAVWTISSASNSEWAGQVAWAAAGFGPTQVEVGPKLADVSRLAPDRVPAGQPPVVTPDPGLTPQTVSPISGAPQAAQWLGWETVFIIGAFALPGISGATIILAKHLGGVSDLNQFKLPLPHHLGVSLFLLVFNYLTSALTVPIALLLLARTGQPPSVLGLRRSGLRRDLASSAAMYAGIWALNLLVGLAFFWALSNKHLSNTETNSHVPAYYIIYALLLSATTAINEEVLVNGYFLTRLSQLGWTPWRAFALSLAVRTSYHAYYGVALVATIPLGYVVTRSFQKRQRLARPILVHFTYDAVLLTIAVLTS